MLTDLQREEISSYLHRATRTINYNIRAVLRREDEDIFQRVCLLICKHWESDRDRPFPLMWAGAIARNVAIQSIRNGDLDSHCEITPGIYNQHRHTMHPERIYSAREQLQKILEQIPAKYLSVMPQVMGIEAKHPSNTVKTQRRRAVEMARGVHADLQP